MNFRMIFKSLGMVLCIEAACMLPSFIISAISGEGDSPAFLFSMTALLAAGFLLSLIKPAKTSIYARDGFAIVALGWITVSLFGSLPFLFSGAIPSFWDAFFESVSGFSTTGATILKDIESLPKGILFWRSFTHWMGGMGVLVLTLAILPSVGANSFHIMKAESPGPTPGKLVPKIGQTAKILYSIYIVLTLGEVLLLLAGGMSLYDALIHAFGTAGTGGFSNKNSSIGYYDSPYLEGVITVFMLLFGINFALYYYGMKGNLKSVYKDEELRFYLFVVGTSVLFIGTDLASIGFYSPGTSFREAAFQVSSIITTTGYATVDFNLWPVFSQGVLMVLMFIGGSAGSTGGGIKCIRILVLLKVMRREIARVIHPRSVYTVKIGGKVVEEETLSGIMTFFFVYLFLFVLATLAISLNGEDLITTVTSVGATLNNVGPGLGLVGPMGNFSGFSDFSKAVLSACMIFGRLEIYPMLILFSPAFWKKVNI